MIESFKIPKFIETENPNRQFRVFRDKDELTTKDLSTMIKDALMDSEFLLVICSKRTPLSPWCTKEAREFRKTHDDSKIIPVLIEGEPEESFNEELKSLKMTVVTSENSQEEKELEVLAADIRPEGTKELTFEGYETLEKTGNTYLEKFTKESLSILRKTEIYRIMASILNISYGDLKLRHRERKLRRIIHISLFSALVMLIFGICVTSLYIKSIISERKANEQSSLMTLNMADNANEEGNRLLSLLISEEALKNISPKMKQYNKIMAQYERVLNDSLLALPYSSQFMFNTESQYSFFALSSDGKWIVSNGPLNSALVFSLENGVLLKSIDFDSPVTALSVSPDNKTIFAGTSDGKLFSINTTGYSLQKISEDRNNPVTGLLVSPDGKYLYTRKGALTLEIFNVSSGKSLSSVVFEKGNTIKSFRINPLTNNFFIITGNNSLAEYDVQTGKLIRSFSEPTGEEVFFSRIMSISKNGILVFSDLDGENYKIVVKNLNTDQTNEITGLFSPTTSIQIDRNGKYLYISEKKKSISKYDISNLSEGEQINKKERVTYYSTISDRFIKNLLINPEGTNLAVIMDNNHMEVFEGIRDSFSPIIHKSDLGKSSSEVILSEFSPDGEKIILSVLNGSIKVISSKSSLENTVLNGEIIGSSRDKSNLLVYNGESLLKYNFRDNKITDMGKPAKEFFHMYGIFSANNDVSLVALSSPGGSSADVFDVKSKSRIYSTKSHNVPSGHLPFLKKADFSMDGKLLFTLGPDDSLFVSDSKTGNFLFSLENKEKVGATGFILSHDDSFVAINYSQGKALVFSLKTRKVVKEIEGEVLFIDSRENSIKGIYGQHGSQLFHYTNEKKPIHYINTRERSGKRNIFLNRESVSSDGKYLIINVVNSDTIIINLATGEKVRTLRTEREFNDSIPVISLDGTKAAYNFNKHKFIVTNIYSVQELSKMAESKLKGRKITEEELSSIGRRE